MFRLQFDEFQIVSSSHDDSILIWDFLNVDQPQPGSPLSQNHGAAGGPGSSMGNGAAAGAAGGGNSSDNESNPDSPRRNFLYPAPAAGGNGARD